MERKLSECIREGAKLRAQAFGDYVRDIATEGMEWGPYEYRTCALGAAYEAITGKLPKPDWQHPLRTRKAIYQACGVQGVRIPYPEGVAPGEKALVVNVVSSLNDGCKWSREKIADYLESVGY